MRKISLLLIFVCLSNILYSQSDSLELYYLTAISDFFKTRDIKRSDKFSILFEQVHLENTLLYSVSILPEDECRYFLSNADGVGKPYYTEIKYIEINEKLFFWQTVNPYFILDEDTYNKLVEYDNIKHVDVPSQEWLLGWGWSLRDGDKVWQYYFIPGNYTKFKKTYCDIMKIPRAFRKGKKQKVTIDGYTFIM